MNRNGMLNCNFEQFLFRICRYGYRAIAVARVVSAIDIFARHRVLQGWSLSRGSIFSARKHTTGDEVFTGCHLPRRVANYVAGRSNETVIVKPIFGATPYRGGVWWLVAKIDMSASDQKRTSSSQAPGPFRDEMVA